MSVQMSYRAQGQIQLNLQWWLRGLPRWRFAHYQLQHWLGTGRWWSDWWEWHFPPLLYQGTPVHTHTHTHTQMHRIYDKILSVMIIIAYRSYRLWCGNCHSLSPLPCRSSQWNGIHNILGYISITHCRHPPPHFSHSRSDQPHRDITWSRWSCKFTLCIYIIYCVASYSKKKFEGSFYV